MEQYNTIPLFSGMDRERVEELLNFLGAYERRCPKGTVLFREQDEVPYIGVFCTGSGTASRLDISGREFLMAVLSAGSVFGDVMAVGQGKRSPVTLTVTGEAKILFLPKARLFQPAGGLQLRFLENLMDQVSKKYFYLQDRMSCILRPSLRDKLLAYLSELAEETGDPVVQVPMDRNQLASYLNADRSALCRELSNMKAEGILEYHKNTFRLFHF